MNDKLKALELLGKHLGLFNQPGDVGRSPVFIFSDKTIEEEKAG